MQNICDVIPDVSSGLTSSMQPRSNFLFDMGWFHSMLGNPPLPVNDFSLLRVTDTVPVQYSTVHTVPSAHPLLRGPD